MGICNVKGLGFPNIRGTILGGFNTKDYCIFASILVSP